MFDLGSAETVRRIARWFGMRGRIELQLDRNVVPVAVVGDLDTAPFRRSGVRWHRGADLTQTAVQAVGFGLKNDSPNTIRIDDVLISSTAAILMDWGFRGGISAGFLATSVPVVTRELFNTAGGVGRELLPIGFMPFVQGSASNIAIPYGSLRIPAGGVVQVPLEIVIEPTGAVSQDMFLLECTLIGVAASVSVQFRGRYWDDVPGLLTTQTG